MKPSMNILKIKELPIYLSVMASAEQRVPYLAFSGHAEIFTPRSYNFN